MIDRYTKFMLTCIAASLLVLAYSQLRTLPAQALVGPCGGPYNPCYIAVNRAIDVKIREPLEIVSYSAIPVFQSEFVTPSKNKITDSDICKGLSKAGCELWKKGKK